MPSVQNAIANRDCDTHSTSGPINLLVVDDFSLQKKRSKIRSKLIIIVCSTHHHQIHFFHPPSAADRSTLFEAR